MAPRGQDIKRKDVKYEEKSKKSYIVSGAKSGAENAAVSRAGFVAIIGAPNAGKSTLVNALVGEKVSIVTHKVQTTRFQLRGIAMIDGAQLVLVDTPGIFSPKEKDRLGRSMVHAAWSGAGDADAIVHMVDAPAFARQLAGKGSAQDRLAHDDTLDVMKGLEKRKTLPRFLALNKIDDMARDELLSLISQFDKRDIYDQVFLISALDGDGVDDLSGALVTTLPEGPYLYPPDQAADVPSRLMAAEITREKLFLRLHDELPYASMVETEKWTRFKNGDIRIEQVIYVQRKSQKPIVLGKGGQTIKQIGAAARKEMEEWLGGRVHLFLFVKVRENWRNDPARYAGTGLEYNI